MKSLFKYIFVFLFCALPTQQLHSQEKNAERRALEPLFEVRGSVRESDTYKPISKVNIEVNGGAYTVTGNDGDFRIKVRTGDELIIRHKDFETVYYKIKDNERITVEVKPSSSINHTDTKYKKSIKSFNSLIDSASVNLKKDAEKSIQFVTDALLQSSSVKQSAEAYELLADINVYWKQYDLAVSNYRISLQNTSNNEVKLKLGKAYELNKNYQESIETYKGIKNSELSNWQLITMH